MYADTESILESVDNNKIVSGAYQKHVPHTIAFYIKCELDDFILVFECYREKDCILWLN